MSINFLFSSYSPIHMGRSLEKYLEFSLKNLEQNGNFTPNILIKPGICFGIGSENSVDGVSTFIVVVATLQTYNYMCCVLQKKTMAVYLLTSLIPWS